MPPPRAYDAIDDAAMRLLSLRQTLRHVADATLPLLASGFKMTDFLSPHVADYAAFADYALRGVNMLWRMMMLPRYAFTLRADVLLPSCCA